MSDSIIIADLQSYNKKGHSEGHYFSVAENYYDILSDDFNIIVAGGPVYQKKFKSMFLLPHDCKAEEPVFLQKLKTIINGLYLLRNVKDGAIVFQCSAVSTIIGLLTIIRPKTRIFLIQYDNMISSSRLKRMLFRIAKKRIQGIICSGKEIGENLGLPYCIVPDYIYSGNKMDSSTSIKYDFGIYGILSADKGVLEAAEFFAKTNYSLKIAGKIAGLAKDQEMARKLENLVKTHANLDISIGYLPEAEYHDYIAATRYIVLNYSGVYMNRSSGVILDALYAGKPVLAKRREYVEFVEENGLGILFDRIQDLNMDDLFEDEKYSTMQSNINVYLTKQKNNIKRLKNFLID